MRWLFDLQQCGEAFAHFIEQFDWSHASYFNVSFLPRDTAHLIHQNDARNSVSGWNGNFKRVTSRPPRNWTNDTKTRSHIVLPRSQHDRWTMTALFVAKRGIEIDPDQLAGIQAIITRPRCQQVAPIRARGGGSLELYRQPVGPKCIGVDADWAWQSRQPACRHELPCWRPCRR
jgi:hypothetical protein